MRSPQVAPATKMVAVGVGIAATIGLMILELPLEGVLSVFLPLGGLAFDAAIDGLEALILPLFIACAVLPLIAPKAPSRRPR